MVTLGQFLLEITGGFSLSSVVIIPLVKYGRALVGTSGCSCFSGEPSTGNSGLDQV